MNKDTEDDLILAESLRLLRRSLASTSARKALQANEWLLTTLTRRVNQALDETGDQRLIISVRKPGAPSSRLQHLLGITVNMTADPNTEYVHAVLTAGMGHAIMRILARQCDPVLAQGAAFAVRNLSAYSECAAILLDASPIPCEQKDEDGERVRVSEEDLADQREQLVLDALNALVKLASSATPDAREFAVTAAVNLARSLTHVTGTLATAAQTIVRSVTEPLYHAVIEAAQDEREGVRAAGMRALGVLVSCGILRKLSGRGARESGLERERECARIIGLALGKRYIRGEKERGDEADEETLLDDAETGSVLLHALFAASLVIEHSPELYPQIVGSAHCKAENVAGQRLGLLLGSFILKRASVAKVAVRFLFLSLSLPACLPLFVQHVLSSIDTSSFASVELTGSSSKKALRRDVNVVINLCQESVLEPVKAFGLRLEGNNGVVSVGIAGADGAVSGALAGTVIDLSGIDEDYMGMQVPTPAPDANAGDAPAPKVEAQPVEVTASEAPAVEAPAVEAPSVQVEGAPDAEEHVVDDEEEVAADPLA
ncbi:hypothetical protein KIPB_004081 [Kipferlia bialata]|uniref:Armadillo-like helical n=1 Tax=Kipferlia bialata TaxID=797122 RepID=A0A9K3CTX4_9EUKA|nr:hypothetical protein KIPB_004081 [Kipferlia bialata]|eukprot:g4081.t1